jgi:hypothetical protein
MALTPRTQLPATGEQTDDYQLDAIQQTIRDTQQMVNARGPQPVLTGALTFSAGQAIIIEHKLGRQPQEWVPIDVSGGYGVFQRISWSDKMIKLQSQNACTARFRIA